MKGTLKKVVICWHEDFEIESTIICVGDDEFCHAVETEQDDDILFYCNEQEFERLKSEDNGEDFYVIEIY